MSNVLQYNFEFYPESQVGWEHLVFLEYVVTPFVLHLRGWSLELGSLESFTGGYLFISMPISYDL